jgi:hypothetical protein
MEALSDFRDAKRYLGELAMDLGKVLSQLHAELENINAAILSLERLQSSHRRGGAQRVLIQAKASSRNFAASSSPPPGRKRGKKGQ